MANRIIQFKSQQPDISTAPNREVYVDVGMTAVNSTSAPPRKFSHGQTPYGLYKVSRLVNVKAVQNSLRQIFTWIPGERIINPEFGSELQKYLYEGITDQNIEAIVAEVKHCVSKWEPRVVVDKVVNVQTVDDTERNTVRLDIVYHIVGLNDEQFRYTYTYHKAAV